MIADSLIKINKFMRSNSEQDRNEGLATDNKRFFIFHEVIDG